MHGPCQAAAGRQTAAGRSVASVADAKPAGSGSAYPAVLAGVGGICRFFCSLAARLNGLLTRKT